MIYNAEEIGQVFGNFDKDIFQMTTDAVLLIVDL